LKLTEFIFTKSSEKLNGSGKPENPHFYYNIIKSGRLDQVHVYSGWSSNEMIEWVKDNPESDPNCDDYWIKGLINPFKNIIEIRRGMLDQYFREYVSFVYEKEWPKTTTTYCWWCCHPFDNTPCALPENYIKNKFYVYGCFCSFNCATSYNFSLNDNDIWERYSLLNLLYSKIYETKFVKINMAAPRETLRIFGGYMSIEEFREHSYKNDKNFKVIKPPLISIIPKIEENNYNLNKNKITFIPLNKELVEKAENTMKLKREKPVVNPNYTLQTFMDLKKI
jgi:hypothetical protein